MSMLVFISFIIPCYNRANHIVRTIQSITDQSFSNIEIIIVNDGSNDETSEIIKPLLLRDKRIQYLEIQNSERGSARNYGFQYAKGIYVNYFDSDDLLLPCLDKLYQFISQNNQSAVVYGAIQHVDENGIEVKSEAEPHISFTKNLLHNNFLSCGSVFMKREIAGQFLFHEDRRLSSAEDWELWLRIHTRHTFLKFPNYIFQQVHHQERSLTSITPQTIELRDEYFASLILNNDTFRDFYGAQALNLFAADRHTFIALAWCGVNWSNVYSHWLKSLKYSPLVILRKRFWVILKKLILK